MIKKKYNQKLILIFIIGIILLIGGYVIYQNIKFRNTNLNPQTTSEIDTNINTDDGDEDINWSIYEEVDLISKENMKITEPGIYRLSGNINQTVTINTKGNVKLILDNATIKSNNGPAIMVEEAENMVISLIEGTINTLEDSVSYSYDDEDINGVIYSKDDLILEGDGTLNIHANYQDGIVSKDDLKIISGIYQIDSKDDGIRGKDSVYIMNGNFTITSGGDAIQSTNDTDTEKGYILIENGNFELESELDGIDAYTKLVIKNGTFYIKTGGGSSNSSSKDSWGDWGRYQTESLDNKSAKGLKSQDNLVIENGNFILDTSDDSLHSNHYLGIKNGIFDISSGDDGIHADTEIIIDGGNIKIGKSYEGIEAAKITINEGDIGIVASDDGINVAGGNDFSSRNRPGENNYSNNTDNILAIYNGTIYVDATGDGLDANGSIYMYGGTVAIDGPTSSGNGALDYDGECIVDGGTLIAVGSSGMVQSISSNSKQNNIIIITSTTYNNKEITITSKTDEIIKYTPSKSFQAIVISSSKLEMGKEYILKIDSEEIENFTIRETTTSIGSKNSINDMPRNGRR